MRRPHLSQLTSETMSVPMYPVHGLGYNSAIAAAFARPLGLPRCSQLYVEGWQYLEYGCPEAALSTFRELLMLGRQAGHQGWIGAAVQAITDLAAESSSSDGSEVAAVPASARDLQTVQQCNQAMVLQAQGYQQRAMRAYQQVLAYATQADCPLAMARCLNGLGLLYLEQEQYALAATRLQAAVAVLAELNAPVQSAIAAHNLGLAHYQQGHYTTAQTWFQQALNHWQLGEDGLGLALTLDYLGRTYAQQGQSWLALGSFEAATDVLNDLSDHQDTRQAAAALLMQIAGLCEQTQHTDVAIAYWQEVLELYATAPVSALHLIIWQRLSRLYHQAGHIAIARHYAQHIMQASHQ